MKSNILSLLFFMASISLFAVNKDDVTAYIQKDTEIMVDGESITLKAGTQVVVEASQNYVSKNLSDGQSINVRVKFNVVSKKKTLISAGTNGSAIVSNVQKPGMFGRPGKFEVQLQSVQAVDGQQVLVSSSSVNYEGKDKYILAWGLSLLLTVTLVGWAIGFFIKGKDAELKSGSQMNASVASDLEIDLEE